MKDGVEIEQLIRSGDDVQVEPSSRIAPFGHERSWSQGSEWVEIPPSLVERIQEVTQRTGLSKEGIVWEALDFYIKERLYDWVNLGS